MSQSSKTASALPQVMNGGFPKIRGTLFRVPIRRNMIFWGLHSGPPYLGKTSIMNNMFRDRKCWLFFHTNVEV